MKHPDDNDRLLSGALPDDPFADSEPLQENSEAVLADDSRPWKPFPTEMLPRVCAEFVREGAAALGCDEAYLALPMLAAVAGCIGNRRRIMLKTTWCEPAIVWTGIVGFSGTAKSPALHLVFEPLTAKEVTAVERQKERQREYERELKRWKSVPPKQRGPLPDPPSPPERLIVADTTVESLGPLLEEGPNGLILMRDELAGWIKSFDMYRGGRGADAQKWIEMHGGRPMIVDRKGGDKRTICVERAALSIAGGIQPGVLRSALSGENFKNGMAARLLLAQPPRRAKRWTEATVSVSVSAALRDLFAGLRALPPGVGEDGRLAPIDIPLDPRAKETWIDFYNRHARRQEEAESEALAASFSKLEGYAARFALLVYVAEQHTELHDRAGCVDLSAIEKGIGIAEWFVEEEQRVYSLLAEDPAQVALRELVETIRRKGGRITPRELMHASRRYRASTEVAEAALVELVVAGLGSWEQRPSGPKGGQPTTEFVLYDWEREPPQ